MEKFRSQERKQGITVDHVIDDYNKLQSDDCTSTEDRHSSYSKLVNAYYGERNNWRYYSTCSHACSHPWVGTWPLDMGFRPGDAVLRVGVGPVLPLRAALQGRVLRPVHQAPRVLPRQPPGKDEHQDRLARRYPHNSMSTELCPNLGSREHSMMWGGCDEYFTPSDIMPSRILALYLDAPVVMCRVLMSVGVSGRYPHGVEAAGLWVRSGGPDAEHRALHGGQRDGHHHQPVPGQPRQRAHPPGRPQGAVQERAGRCERN
jgi:hypothetical protein